MDEDILQEIPDEDLPLLSNLYKNYAREIPQVHSLLEVSINWKKKKSDSNYLTFFGIENDWLKSGTFILLMQYNCYDLFVFTLEESGKTLFTALTRTKRIDWNRKLLFYSVASKHSFTIINILKELRLPSYLCADTEAWVIEKEKALAFEIKIPDDVYIGPVDISHADLINEHWPHGRKGAEKYLATLIEMNKSFGIFLKSDNSLVSWVLQSPMGQMCNLQTLPEHKKKGYGMLITKVMAKEIAQDGHDPLGTIVRRNIASENMFRKLGFRSIDICSYFIINM